MRKIIGSQENDPIELEIIRVLCVAVYYAIYGINWSKYEHHDR